MFNSRDSRLASAIDQLPKLLHANTALKPAQLAVMLNLTGSDVTAKVKPYEKDHIILGYRTILNEEKLGVDIVRTVIEVKITPERESGFDRLAERIAKCDEVNSCYLMSGRYDLLVVVEPEAAKCEAQRADECHEREAKQAARIFAARQREQRKAEEETPALGLTPTQTRTRKGKPSRHQAGTRRD